ncbi:MAG: hypothetical protein R6U64_04115 [Bacteroidales bacterium]
MEAERNEFDSSNLFIFFIRWWKHLAIICFVAALAGVVFSSPWFITPKFQSTVTMFPATTNSISRSVLGGANAVREDFLEYGDVEDAERLLQVLESAAVREPIVNRYNLMAHYDIPQDSPYRHTLLNKTYQENISFRRTRYGAVEINVRDKDPEMAAAIANSIAEQVDSVQNNIRLKRAVQAFEIARDQYQEMLQEVKNTEDSLRLISRKGVYDIEAQTTMLTQQLAIDLSNNNARGVRAIEQRLDVISEYGGAYDFLSSYLTNISTTLSDLQQRYSEAKVDMENVASFKFIIDPAFVAERKVYPVRWLIVFLSAFAAGFGGIMIIMVYENLLNKGIIKTKK